LSSHPSAKCMDCGEQAQFNLSAPACTACGSQWFRAEYDYEAIGQALPSVLPDRLFNLWRYLELLPVGRPDPNVTMGEGGTPLIQASNLGMMLGLNHLFIKDERQGATASFKDRQAAVNVMALKEARIAEAVLASTGNVAIAYSAYAVRGGIKLWAFLTSLVPEEKMREVALYGTQVVKVTGTYDQAKQLAAEFAHQYGLYLETGARSIPSVEAMKTIAFEIAEQLTHSLGPPIQVGNARQVKAPWRSPDWYIQAVSGGLGPLGVQKGFAELYQMRLINRAPAIACIQTEGCAPMVRAWQAGREVAEVIHSPRTHITTLSTGDPGKTYTLLRKSALRDGGTFESVSDEETFRMIHILAKMEGISVEPAAAVAFAGLVKLVRAGIIKPNEIVVVNCSGHTMPVERTVLGDGWSYDIAATTTRLNETPVEGLLAALSHLSAGRFPRIAIVDDNPDARRLIRRILQARDNFMLFEAANGEEALRLSEQEQLDLIILDLMMPGVDGFSVIDALKENPKTASIPVIVVTAKELTPEENERLDGQIHNLMQKGEFLSDDLTQEVESLVK
jgi:threonine synthase